MGVEETTREPSQEPLVKFDPAEPSAVIRFDIPQPSFFKMKNIIDLKVPLKDLAEWIRNNASTPEEQPVQEPPKKPPAIAVRKWVIPDSAKKDAQIMLQYQRFKTDSEKTEMRRMVERVGEKADIIIPKELYDQFKDVPVVNNMKIVKAYDIAKTLPAEAKLELTKTFTGKYLCTNYYQVPSIPLVPSLAVVEYYRLENYLGNYGTGKTIASFYVHPKSKINLSIRSWTTVKQTYEESSSIFDSMTETASSSFQSSYSSERSKSSEYSAYAEIYASASADAGICGIASVDTEVSTKGGFSLSRSEFSKSVSSTTSQHASEKSSVRQMQHNVTATMQKEEGEEQVLTREIENLNEGHVLNFLVKELNQEYHSVIVLKDVRLVFVYGYLMDEVPLSRIDEFLKRYIDSSALDRYRKFILKECSYVQDFDGNRKSIFEILNFSDDQPTRSTLDESIEAFDSKIHYIRIKGKREKERMGIGKKVGGRETGQEIKVEGIPVDVNTVTLKTDGVLCCSLMDPGLALDEYGQKMQDETLRAKKAQTDLIEAQVAEHNLAKDLIEKGPAEAVARFEKIYSILNEKQKRDDANTSSSPS